MTAPELHGGPDDVVAVVLEEGGGDRGVDTTGHGHEDLHAAPSRSRSTTPGSPSRRGLCPHPTSSGRGTAQTAEGGCLGTPMAISTWLASIAPLVQAEPAEAQTPASSSRSPGAPRSRSPRSTGGNCSAIERPVPVSVAPLTAASSWSARRSRRADTLARDGPVGDRGDHRRRQPAMPATLWVPERRSRSRPPPWDDRRARSRSPPGRPAPLALGPPNLWALTRSRSARPASDATSSHREGLDRVGSGHGGGAAATTRAATSAMGVGMVPRLIVGQHHRYDAHAAVEHGGEAIEVGRSVRHRDDPDLASRPRPRAGRRDARSPSRQPGPGRPARTPRTARLSASVPPPVKMMPPGGTPSAAATTSRASSMAARAASGHLVRTEGLPKRSVSHGSMARAASWRRGLLAA